MSEQDERRRFAFNDLQRVICKEHAKTGTPNTRLAETQAREIAEKRTKMWDRKIPEDYRGE